jgi:hypothetical protein
MESKLANEAKLALLAATRRLTPRAASQCIPGTLSADDGALCGRPEASCCAGEAADVRNAISIAGESLDKVLLERLTKRYGRDAVENLDKLLGN